MKILVFLFVVAVAAQPNTGPTRGPHVLARNYCSTHNCYTEFHTQLPGLLANCPNTPVPSSLRTHLYTSYNFVNKTCFDLGIAPQLPLPETVLTCDNLAGYCPCNNQTGLVPAYVEYITLLNKYLDICTNYVPAAANYSQPEFCIRSGDTVQTNFGCDATYWYEQGMNFPYECTNTSHLFLVNLLAGGTDTQGTINEYVSPTVFCPTFYNGQFSVVCNNATISPNTGGHKSQVNITEYIDYYAYVYAPEELVLYGDPDEIGYLFLGWAVDDDTLKYIGCLSQLQVLNINGNLAITSTMLGYLGGVSGSLRSLGLFDVKFHHNSLFDLLTAFPALESFSMFTGAFFANSTLGYTNLTQFIAPHADSFMTFGSNVGELVYMSDAMFTRQFEHLTAFGVGWEGASNVILIELLQQSNFPELSHVVIRGAITWGIIPDWMCSLDRCNIHGPACTTIPDCCGATLCTGPPTWGDVTFNEAFVNPDLPAPMNFMYDAAYHIDNGRNFSLNCSTTSHVYVLNQFDNTVPSAYCPYFFGNIGIYCYGASDFLWGEFYSQLEYDGLPANGPLVNFTGPADEPFLLWIALDRSPASAFKHIACMSYIRYLLLSQNVSDPTVYAIIPTIVSVSHLPLLHTLLLNGLTLNTTLASIVDRMPHSVVSLGMYDISFEQPNVVVNLLSVIQTKLHELTLSTFFATNFTVDFTNFNTHNNSRLEVFELMGDFVLNAPVNVTTWQQNNFGGLMRLTVINDQFIGRIPEWLCGIDACDLFATRACKPSSAACCNVYPSCS